MGGSRGKSWNKKEPPVQQHERKPMENLNHVYYSMKKEGKAMLKAQFIGFFARLLEGLGMVFAYALAVGVVGAALLLVCCILAEMDKDKEGKKDV